jgi:HD superfamily phosphohydrolase
LYTPEFQRLKSVRLANIDSPTFGSLSDATRYSHTIGALYLASRAPLIEYSPEEISALLAAIVFHDAGSPAFGHLVEYRLKERFGFNHEHILLPYFQGTQHPDNTSQNIRGYGTLRFAKICERIKINTDILRAILMKRHPLSALIFGSLDFDNIDNVARMALLLGLRPPVEDLVELAMNLGVDQGQLALPKRFRRNVELWARARRDAYQILVFDNVAIARQAVLSEAIESCIADGIINADDWDVGESNLLAQLEESPQAKRLLRRYYHESPPAAALHLEITEASELEKLPSAAEIRALADRVLADEFPTRKRFVYAFLDAGTFEKQLRFRCPETGETWEVGERSRSLIIDGFVAGTRPRVEAVRAATDKLRCLLLWRSGPNGY